MNAYPEGQTTAHYIAERIERFPIRVTQLAHGLPVGGELDYLDEGKMAQAPFARVDLSLDGGPALPQLASMSVPEILEVPHLGLRAVAKPVARIDEAVRTIVANMFDTMYDARGIGLAATQVGIERRIVVIDLQEPKSDEEDAKPVRTPLVYIKPELVSVSEETFGL